MGKRSAYQLAAMTAAFVLLILAGRSKAQTSEPDWAAKLDATIEKGVSDNHLPGLAIGIVMDGKLVYSRGFGQATLGANGAKTTPDTLFHMASITKPFVATAIMQLVEQGKVSLDDPVVKYIPYFRLGGIL